MQQTQMDNLFENFKVQFDLFLSDPQSAAKNCLAYLYVLEKNNVDFASLLQCYNLAYDKLPEEYNNSFYAKIICRHADLHGSIDKDESALFFMCNQLNFRTNAFVQIAVAQNDLECSSTREKAMRTLKTAQSRGAEPSELLRRAMEELKNEKSPINLRPLIESAVREHMEQVLSDKDVETVVVKAKNDIAAANVFSSSIISEITRIGSLEENNDSKRSDVYSMLNLIEQNLTFSNSELEHLTNNRNDNLITKDTQNTYLAAFGAPKSMNENSDNTVSETLASKIQSEVPATDNFGTRSSNPGSFEPVIDLEKIMKYPSQKVVINRNTHLAASDELSAINSNCNLTASYAPETMNQNFFHAASEGLTSKNQNTYLNASEVPAMGNFGTRSFNPGSFEPVINLEKIMKHPSQKVEINRNTHLAASDAPVTINRNTILPASNAQSTIDRSSSLAASGVPPTISRNTHLAASDAPVTISRNTILSASNVQSTIDRSSSLAASGVPPTNNQNSFLAASDATSSIYRNIHPVVSNVPLTFNPNTNLVASYTPESMNQNCHQTDSEALASKNQNTYLKPSEGPVIENVGVHSLNAGSFEPVIGVENIANDHPQKVVIGFGPVDFKMEPRRPLSMSGLRCRDNPAPPQSLPTLRLQATNPVIPDQENRAPPPPPVVGTINLVEKSMDVVFLNSHRYRILRSIGSGGFSKVYSVLDDANREYALKIVSLTPSYDGGCGVSQKSNQMLLKSLRNEVLLLQQLSSSGRVVRLYDSEETPQRLLLLLEKADVDFSHLFKQGIQDTLKIAFYWTEMLLCVHALHEHGIVHLDLKPANFVLVAGHPKLIDLGISRQLPNDVTSVAPNSTTGTVSYMSPEQLYSSVVDDNEEDEESFLDEESANAMKPNSARFRVGRKSDVWSMGCILYSMIYGKTPFARFTNSIARARAICDAHVEIRYPSVANCTPAMVNIMKRCLVRDKDVRASIEELLQYNMLETRVSPQGPLKDALNSISCASPTTQANFLNYVKSFVKKEEESNSN